jgi:hypothetical protein
MTVPLGAWYLELIAIVDEPEARASDRSRRVLDAVQAGRTFVTWAVRSPDLDDLREQLVAAGRAVSEIRDGSRRTPDGRLLRWRTLELGGGVLPFVIEWRVPEQEHPGRARSANAAVERPAVTLSGEDADARAFLEAALDQDSVWLAW